MVKVSVPIIIVVALQLLGMVIVLGISFFSEISAANKVHAKIPVAKTQPIIKPI